jgi:hypothetical protein
MLPEVGKDVSSLTVSRASQSPLQQQQTVSEARSVLST